MRDILKNIDEYDAMRKANRGSTLGVFFPDDLKRIIAKNDGQLYDSVSDALRAGWMIGYRAGQRAKKGR